MNNNPDTVGNTQYQQAATAYRGTHVETMSGFEIVVELYRGIIKNIEEAKIAYQEGRLDDMCELNAKTNQILAALQSHLDFENGGEASEFLNSFYNGIFASLAQILRKPHPEKQFDEILDSIRPVYEIWCGHAQNEAAAGNAAAETASAVSTEE